MTNDELEQENTELRSKVIILQARLRDRPENDGDELMKDYCELMLENGKLCGEINKLTDDIRDAIAAINWLLAESGKTINDFGA